MKNGYKIFWTDYALNELEQTITYLEENWTEKELRNLASKIEETLELLSQNPNLFQRSEIKKDVRRAVVLTHNTLYYRINGDTVEVISFFSNRQNPKKRKLK
ncbi:type II toxin-antitoxin system RelE/ParE family toxin [Mucilaginibacter arboris]|uniref:Type II toxin-antitoxin system RelE/ParE family toxin n=1 Tax=Mucilaginibacter arboris TaxID=2682090 RepID=A0A7K1STN7_9SPHI|nr:type II toxin-antitoxin system RelE/ParE family toxin [Mucilaginibacter arboris]MVN20665.1 type II toxin-antitoxin system RelE/ParE family toxin [Mucilaginibacter arboris]